MPVLTIRADINVVAQMLSRSGVATRGAIFGRRGKGR